MSPNEPLRQDTLAFFQRHAADRLRDLVLHAFFVRQERKEITVELVAARLRMEPVAVAKLLAIDARWKPRLDLVSDLLLAMGLELTFGADEVDLLDRPETDQRMAATA